MHRTQADVCPDKNHIGVATPTSNTSGSAHPPEAHETGTRPLHAVAAPTRCHDLDRWHRAVSQANDLALRQTDGRTRVGTRTVKQVLFALRAYMDGPGRPDPGAHARPGVERLAADVGLQWRTVERALAAAVQHGYLIQTRAGNHGRYAEFAAALPPVDNQARRDERCEAPHTNFGEGVRPLPRRCEAPHTDPPQYLRSNPHPPARQLPLVAAVDNRHGEGEGMVKQLLDRLPNHVTRHVDLTHRRLAEAVAEAHAAGWTATQLAGAVLALDNDLGPLDGIDDQTRTAGAIAFRIRRVLDQSAARDDRLHDSAVAFGRNVARTSYQGRPLSTSEATERIRAAYPNDPTLADIALAAYHTGRPP